MQNKTILLCFTIVTSLLLFACGSKNLEKDVKATFVGTIQEITGDSAIVDAFEEDGKVLGPVKIDLAVNPNETFQIGDKVRVGYDGMVRETVPLGVNTITVKKIE